ncbi:hypothetical protein M116_1581 [Bacteroides fragilis str. 3719 A10]|nr:hypothetical protein M072_4407 [Bacteroides fragilis str. DS-208]EXZ58812.1 hypothetical protein M116_1581 [Bacteroides fragilis str. 3719 A10]EXZ89828.1 hypothetical protein M068_1525 [Bacteroides fragilis str. J38-1]
MEENAGTSFISARKGADRAKRVKSDPVPRMGQYRSNPVPG